MSLDVYLECPGKPVAVEGSGIFIRENGGTHQITRAEWDERFPGRAPVVVVPEGESETVFHANVTHNLTRIARLAGIYEVLWRPDESGITKAEQLIAPLEDGLKRLKATPEEFVRLNPENGWGSYDAFIPWVERYLAACIQNPTAKVHASR